VPVPYSVRWLEAQETTDAHLAVWERNHSSADRARRRFDWLYRDNPAGPGRVAILEAHAPGRPPEAVGLAGIAARAVRLGSEVRTAGLMADIAVDRAHRTILPALTLIRELRRAGLERHRLSYGFPNDRVVGIVTRAGCRTLGQTRRFAQVLRHGRYLRESLPAPFAALAGGALDLARAALVAGRGVLSSLQHRLEWPTRVDARFDQLWEEAAGAYPAIGVRDAAFVRWRFLERPAGPLPLAALVRRDSGALDGYAVVAREGTAAQVCDLFARPPLLPLLLSSLAAALARQGAESISMRVCGTPAAAAALEALGFRERADKRTIILDSDGVAAPAQADGWYLTDADEDA
jgi:hypothetical protein